MLKRRISSAAALLVILSLLIKSTYNILSFKYGDGILGLEYLYEQDENTVDLLVLGSSHAFEDVNTAILYDRYGISSYILAGSVQPFWNSYYYLLEALRTQHPKMVILEGYMAVQDFDYSDHSRIIKNNLGIKNFFTRLESIMVSSPDEKKDDYIFSYRLWHSRYEEVNESDFAEYYDKPLYQYYKGFGMNFAKISYERPGVETFRGSVPINQKEELYFRKILEVCGQQQIPVMVVVSPYVLTEGEQQKYNYLEEIAQEYEVPFINYNSKEEYERIGMDFSEDMADEGHLNYQGTVKYTEVLGKDIRNYLPLGDHRGDKKYDSWEMNSKDIHARIADYEVETCNDCDTLINFYDRDNQIIYLYTISDTGRIYEAVDLFYDLGIKDGLLQDGAFYLLDGASFQKVSSETLQWNYEQMLDGRYLLAEKELLICDGKVINENSLMFDGSQFILEQEGIYLFIYNRFTKNFVGVKHIKISMDGMPAMTVEK